MLDLVLLSAAGLVAWAVALALGLRLRHVSARLASAEAVGADLGALLHAERERRQQAEAHAAELARWRGLLAAVCVRVGIVLPGDPGGDAVDVPADTPAAG